MRMRDWLLMRMMDWPLMRLMMMDCQQLESLQILLLMKKIVLMEQILVVMTLWI